MVQRVLLVFIDGLGVGERNPDINPLARIPEGHLTVFENSSPASERAGAPPGGECAPRRVKSGGIPLPLDAILGVDGIPQSATGQTALLTGVNAAEMLGRHLFGFPNGKLREIIMEHSLLKRIRERERTAAFLNAFRPRFFDLGDAVWEKPLSVTTWANRAAGLPFFTLDDIAAGRSIYQEFTNRVLRERGFDLPLLTPEEAGAVLARRSRDFDFVLYEYFRTDGAGHSQDMERAVGEAENLERFLGSMLDCIDRKETLVILTSDHGNMENLELKSHTRNPALTVLWGEGAEDAASRLDTILDVAGVVLHALD